MNKDFYIKRDHIFKKRLKSSKQVLTSLINSKRLLSAVQQNFEYVYIRFIKKIIRRKFIKTKTRFFRLKFLFFLRINYILSSKSKNARMGAGVGALVRLITKLYKYSKLAMFIKYSLYNILRLKNIIYIKTKLKFFLRNDWFFITCSNN